MNKQASMKNRPLTAVPAAPQVPVGATLGGPTASSRPSVTGVTPIARPAAPASSGSHVHGAAGVDSGGNTPSVGHRPGTLNPATSQGTIKPIGVNVDHGSQMNAPKSVEMEHLVQVGHIIKIQNRYRVFLVRKEAKRAKDDNKKVMDKGVLISELHALGAQRRANLWSIGFYVMLAVFFAMVITETRNSYDGVGFLKDTLMGNYWGSGDSTGFDVRCPADFYAFLENSVVKAAAWEKEDSANSYLYTHQMFLIDDIYVIMKRNKVKTGCNTNYPSNLKEFIFFDQKCPSEEILKETHVRDTNANEWAWEDWYNNWTSTGTTEVAGFIAGTICPDTAYSETEASYPGHYIIIPVTNLEYSDVDTEAERLQVTGLMKTCDVIDEYVRQIIVTIRVQGRTREPVFGAISIFFDITYDGSYSVSVQQFSYNLESDSGEHRNIYILLWTLAVMSFVGIGIVAVDFCIGCFYYGRLWVATWMKDPSHLFNLLSYVLVIMTCSFHEHLWQVEDEFAATTTWSGFASQQKVVQSALNEYKLLKGLAAAVLMLKVLYYFRHRGMLSMLLKAIYVVQVPLLHFLGSLGLIFCAFAVWGSVQFGHSNEGFSSVQSSTVTLLNWTFGDFDYVDLSRSVPWGSRWVSFIYFYGFLIFVVLILTNFFVAIVMEGYGAVYQRKDVQMPLWEQIFIDCRALYHEFIGSVVTPDDLVWVLRHYPRFLDKPTVTLSEIRTMFPLRWTPEVKDVVVDVMEQSAIDADEARNAVDGPPYRYICIRDMHLVCRSRYRYLPGASAMNRSFYHLTSMYQQYKMKKNLKEKKLATKKRKMGKTMDIEMDQMTDVTKETNPF